MKLYWNTLHQLSREEILGNACLQSRFAFYEWEELDEWIRDIIQENVLARSGGLVQVI